MRVALLVVILSSIASSSSVLTGSIVTAAAQEQQQDDKKELAVKPKRVITNDDIKSSPFTGFGGLFYTNAGSINDCDANCFDQLRIFTQTNAEKNPDWRREVLEVVRSDSEWQAYLNQLYEAHRKVCQLTFDKADELRKSGNARNLGPQEIAITEKYDLQTKTAQAELAAVVAQQSTMQKKFSDKLYANVFATMQGTRMRSGFCSPARVIYPR